MNQSRRLYWGLFVVALVTLGFKVEAYVKLSRATTDLLAQTNGQVAGASTTRQLSTLPPLPAYPVITEEIPTFAAHHYALLDVDSNTVVFDSDGNTAAPLASTTKVMTSILALEHGNIRDILEVQPEATEVIGSTASLVAGEKLTLKDMLYAALLPSGNDAAFSLAHYVGSLSIGSDNTTAPTWDDSIKKTVALMNQKAKELHLDSLSYTDPSGLDDQDVGSAIDMARLAAYALKDPTFREVVSTPKITIHNQAGNLAHDLTNSNRLVGEWSYPGAIGVKTGFTPAAGHNLIAAVERNGHTLVAVVMNTDSLDNAASATVARDMMDFAWRAISWR